MYLIPSAVRAGSFVRAVTDGPPRGRHYREMIPPQSAPGASQPLNRPPSSERGQPTPGWRSRDILRAVAIVAGFYLALQVLWLGRSVLLLGFLGVLFGLTLSVAVDWLQHRRIPRGIGALMVVLAVLGMLFGLGALTAPQIGSQVRELRQQLPAAIKQVEQWVEERQSGVTNLLEQVAPEPAQPAKPDQPAAQAPPGEGEGAAPAIRRGLADQLSSVGQYFFSFFSSTVAVLGGMLLIVVVAVFVAVEPQLYHGGMMHLFPHRTRARTGEVLSQMAILLRRWLITQLIAMVVIGVVTTVVLMLIGVKAALALGIIAGILEFIPYAGPILSAVPAIAMAFLNGPETALYVTLAYIAIQQLESNLLLPLLMKEGLDLPPLVTLLGQAVLALVFGFIGLLVAVPLLGAAMVPIKMLYVQDVVGDDVSLPGDEAQS